MIYYLKGKIEKITAEFLIMDVNNIGYQIFAPQSLLEKVNTGEEIKIFTYLVIKENDNTIELYGFKDNKNLEFFKLLKSVSRIGPKSALRILSLSTVSNLQQAILSENIDILTKVSGIGKKTAKRIVLELKGKFNESDKNLLSKDDVLIVEALKKMGYSPLNIREAIKKIPDNISGTQERVKEALKILSK